jgi:hypothetical protein
LRQPSQGISTEFNEYNDFNDLEVTSTALITKKKKPQQPSAVLRIAAATNQKKRNRAETVSEYRMRNVIQSLNSGIVNIHA